MTTDARPRRPAVFVGYGSPMNALDRNRQTDAWRALGERMPRPDAILATSPHWHGRGTAVPAMAGLTTRFNDKARALIAARDPVSMLSFALAD